MIILTGTLVVVTLLSTDIQTHTTSWKIEQYLIDMKILTRFHIVGYKDTGNTYKWIYLIKIWNLNVIIDYVKILLIRSYIKETVTKGKESKSSYEFFFLNENMYSSDGSSLI